MILETIPISKKQVKKWSEEIYPDIKKMRDNSLKVIKNSKEKILCNIKLLENYARTLEKS